MISVAPASKADSAVKRRSGVGGVPSFGVLVSDIGAATVSSGPDGFDIGVLVLPGDTAGLWDAVDELIDPG
jgi:hypothetical protein